MDRATDRRQFVQVLSGGLAIGLAGCLGGDEDETEENGENSENGTDAEGSAGLAYAFGPETIGLDDRPDRSGRGRGCRRDHRRRRGLRIR
ncbi:hypothetical protein C484_07506 [Natrialba taiwanensis DSM 12281]|uniref:Uncharacterized protein n=1 Tax=Natrialba taiwanensis DSM 12281 TaxID=1230458 RepID=M0A739_9EURY|nr:hypothetical protein C484_07506 [Natrialba taiwanensis DSM 12281]